jgi:hypothetical protein
MLGQLRAYASDVSECTAALNVPAECAAQRDELKELADLVVKEIDEPLRIGIVGEFSAGKSLLLGVLVGKPDLLPTGMEPMTGNVTELRFLPARDNAARTGVSRVEVRFFSRTDADQLDAAILAELRTAAVRANIGDVALAEFDAQCGSWTPKFRDWCARTARQHYSELGKLIRELAMLRDASTAAPGWLGRSVSISGDQLKAILEIRFPGVRDGLPSTPAADSVPFTPSPDDSRLSAVFPLVSRVILDIALPSDAWPVAGRVGDQGFMLLDFPGIGGANSKARDLFLTRRGLEDVHTILVLVNAGRAGGQIPDTFYGFLRELDGGRGDGAAAADRLSSRIVYCAGRFDELQPPKALINDPFDTTGVTVDGLLTACRPLAALLESGHQPGLAAMRAFVSSVLAITRLGLGPVPADLDVERYRGQAGQDAEAWREIAVSLRANAAGGELASGLLGYAADGGVAELRRLLDQHVDDNGLKLRTEKAQHRLDELDELKARLENALRASTPPSEPDSPGVRATAVARDLRRRQQGLVKQAAQLRDAAQLKLPTGWSVREDVQRKAADVVMAWPEWEAIFESVRNNVVTPRMREVIADPFAIDDTPGEDAPAAAGTGLPQRLGEFQEAFSRACEDLRGYAREQALAGARRWLEDQSTAPDARDLQRRAEALLDAGARERLGKIPTLPSLNTAIDRILRPNAIAAGLEHNARRADPQPAAAPAFPMRPRQLTRWADGTPPDDLLRHFIRVSLLRSALIASVSDYAQGCLDAMDDWIATQLQDYYGGEFTRLPDGGRFAATVLGSTAGEPDEAPDPAAALAALRRPDRDPDFPD